MPKLLLVPIKDIIVLPDRQRSTFNTARHVELVDSITDRGLLHPLVARQSNQGFVLTAGERRLRACKELSELGQRIKFNGDYLPLNHVAITNLGDIDELEAEEVEFEENMRRAELTWREEAEAIQRLLNLRKAQALRQGGSTDKEVRIQVAAELIVKNTPEGQTPDLSPAALKYQSTAITQNLLIAQNLDNPKVAKANSAKEAFRIIKTEEARLRNEELARVVGASFNAANHTVVQADCLDWMSRQSPGQFDVILTDPPYGMNAHKNNNAREGYSNITHTYDDTPEHWLKLMKAWTELSYEIAKVEAHAYVFCDIDNFKALRDLMTIAGWSVFRTPLVYYKQHVGRVSWPEYGPRRQYELVLYALKGEKKVTSIFSDVIPGTSDPNLGHAAQKPVAVYQNLLQRSVKPGDRVLDTFAGSGTIFPACHTLKCYATGIEQDANGYGLCLQRIKRLEQEG